MPSVPALKRQGQGDLHEFKASLVYKTSSRTAQGARVTQRNPIKKKKKELFVNSSRLEVSTSSVNDSFFFPSDL